MASKKARGQKKTQINHNQDNDLYKLNQLKEDTVDLVKKTVNFKDKISASNEEIKKFNRLSKMMIITNDKKMNKLKNKKSKLIRKLDQLRAKEKEHSKKIKDLNKILDRLSSERNDQKKKLLEYVNHSSNRVNHFINQLVIDSKMLLNFTSIEKSK